MIPRFVAFGALALSLAAGSAISPAFAQTSAPAQAATPAADAAPVAVPTPTVVQPTPVSVPTLPPSATIDPYVKSAIDLLTGVVNRQFQTARNESEGRVSYFYRFEMQVQTGPHSYRVVHLHQGTIINPRGALIAVGMHVHVEGDAQTDGSLAATEISIVR